MKILKCRGTNPIYLIFLMGFVVLIIGNIIVANELRKRTIAADWVTHTYEVINKINSFSLNFIEAERQLELSIYNNKHYSAYRALMLSAQENLSEIKKLTVDNEHQQMRIPKVELLIKQALNLFQRMSNNLETVKSSPTLIDIEQAIISIKQLTNTMRAEELSLLKQRNKKLEHERVSNIIGIIATTIIGYLFLILAFIAIIRLSKKMEKDHLQMQQLEHDKLVMQENQRIELEFSLNAFKLGYWNLNLETNNAQRSLLHDQIFGYSTLLPEWTYEKFLSHVHPDDCERVDEAFKSAATNDHSWEFECRIYRADDSSIRWVWGIGKTLIVNQCNHIFGLVKDITERKNNELALQTTLSKYNALLEATPDCLIICNKEGKIVFANRVAEKIFGYNIAAIVGQKIEFLLPTRYQTHHEKTRQDYFERPKLRPMGQGLELFGQHKDGHEFPVEISLSPIETEEGLLVLAAVRDITERKKIEDSKSMLSALVESSDEAIIGKDLQGIIFSWNKSAETLYGYTETEMIGSSIKTLFPEGKQGEFDTILQMIKRSEHIKDKESVRLHKDGHEIPVSITISPIKNAQGKVIGASTTARDITQQKLLEEKLKHLAEHDPLTGLINRTIFEDRMEQAVALTKRQKSIMAVFYIDLDGFKEINDLYGHAVGDQILCAATIRMQESRREIDTLARLGGDEFALILVGFDKEQDVIKIVKKLLRGFSKGFLIDNKNLKVTASIGISLFPKDSEPLLEKADAAMYYVKKHGKNNYKFYDDSVTD